MCERNRRMNSVQDEPKMKPVIKSVNVNDWIC